MAIHEILQMGHPTLRRVSQKVTLEEMNSSETKMLLRDMFETLEDEGGIGLAAPQIGVLKQVVIIKVPPESSDYPESEETPTIILFNPEIVILDKTPQDYWEGCLSVTGLRGLVSRPSRIQIDFQDELGQKKTTIASDFLATVYQHEIDHLNGILYIDKLKSTQLFAFEEEYESFLRPKKEDGS